MAAWSRTTLAWYHAAYYETQSEEDAWTALVNVMGPVFRAHLLFLYPSPGNGNKVWRPSWKQAMDETCLPEGKVNMHGWVEWDEETETDRHNGVCIEEGYVRGLSVPGNAEDAERCGEIIVKDTKGVIHAFKIVATHHYPIPEDSYTLIGIGNLPSRMENWVVGRRQPAQTFEKISVFKMTGKEIERLEDLGIAKDSYNYNQGYTMIIDD
ncbi:hypothetical protein ARMSODRAFT_983682 [Armillaria solidipes]|uniref:Uncharacterized protein n=1 Tax=Armillaria solidipes TaxID=1076256 RepID=A0A2H3AI17_9AGAR|nr:hypothetical protein ARMSODRAFT_983682 [Armillaria solidipes]